MTAITVGVGPLGMTAITVGVGALGMTARSRARDDSDESKGV